MKFAQNRQGEIGEKIELERAKEFALTSWRIYDKF